MLVLESETELPKKIGLLFSKLLIKDEMEVFLINNSDDKEGEEDGEEIDSDALTNVGEIGIAGIEIGF